MFPENRTVAHQASSPANVLCTLLFVLSIAVTSFAQRQSAPQKATNGHNAERPKVGQVAESKDIDFRPVVTYYSGGTYPTSVAVADLNGDGKPDLVLPNSNSNNVGVLLGNGDGTFQPVVTYASGGQGPFSVAIADVNHDGKLDALVANQCAGSNCQSGRGSIGVLLGNGDGTLQPAVTYDAGSGQSLFVAVADVNGDSKLDVAVTNWGSTAGVLLGRGDGTFKPVVTYDTGADSDSVTIADVNGDGKPDLLVGDQTTVAVLLGNGDGTFQPKVEHAAFPPGAPPPYGVGTVTVADLNGDGNADLVTADEGGMNNGDGSLGVLLGIGSGSFQPVVPYDSGGKIAFSAAVSDVNGDGKMDLVGTNYNYDNGNGSVGVLLGNGDGTFRSVVTFDSGGLFAFSVAIADINGDGKPDLLVANQAANSVGVLINRPPGVSTSTSLVSTINPAQPRQRVDYIATVTTESGGTPTGTVTFREGNQTLATVPLSGNQARLNYNHYTQNQLGAHSITAAYSGDADNDPSTSPVLTEYVQWTSRIDLRTSGSPSLVGQPVTFSATAISHGNSVPDGEIISFFDGKTLLSNVPTTAGIATFTTSSLSAKRHTIHAIYQGDSERQPSNIATIKQVVNKYSTTVNLSSSANPSAKGQSVTFTATVTSSGAAVPTGKVKFLDGTMGIGFANLSAGVASIAKSTLTVGTHSITAQYLGDDVSDESTSSVVNQVVNP